MAPSWRTIWRRLVALHGAETIAAVIVEPVAGSTGVLLPPKGYLERLRAITQKYGILLIFDEVITGFGRMGTPFAVDYFGVVPDLVTTAKGLTNGAIPMGAVFASRAVHDALMQGPAEQIELFHGYTYSGHPAACAAGLATLGYVQKGRPAHPRRQPGAGLADLMHRLERPAACGGHPHHRPGRGHRTQIAAGAPRARAAMKSSSNVWQWAFGPCHRRYHRLVAAPDPGAQTISKP